MSSSIERLPNELVHEIGKHSDVWSMRQLRVASRSLNASTSYRLAQVNFDKITVAITRPSLNRLVTLCRYPRLASQVRILEIVYFRLASGSEVPMDEDNNGVKFGDLSPEERQEYDKFVRDQQHLVENELETVVAPAFRRAFSAMGSLEIVNVFRGSTWFNDGPTPWENFPKQAALRQMGISPDTPRGFMALDTIEWDQRQIFDRTNLFRTITLATGYHHQGILALNCGSIGSLCYDAYAFAMERSDLAHPGLNVGLRNLRYLAATIKIGEHGNWPNDHAFSAFLSAAVSLQWLDLQLLNDLDDPMVARSADDFMMSLATYPHLPNLQRLTIGDVEFMDGHTLRSILYRFRSSLTHLHLCSIVFDEKEDGPLLRFIRRHLSLESLNIELCMHQNPDLQPLWGGSLRSPDNMDVSTWLYGDGAKFVPGPDALGDRVSRFDTLPMDLGTVLLRDRRRALTCPFNIAML